MEDSAKDQSSVSAKDRRLSSRLLRYPLRSASKSKEEIPSQTDSSNSSGPRRGRHAPIVSKSTGVLDFSGKAKSASKPPRKPSISSKCASTSVGLGLITPISEARTKRSTSNTRRADTPIPDVSKLSNRRDPNALFTASYWLSQIMLSESAANHSISLGLFKLAFEAGSQPMQCMSDELKSYVQRYNLVDFGEPVKQLLESYNILQDFEQLQVSETCSHVPEDAIRSSDDDVYTTSSVADTEKDVTETGQVKEPSEQISSQNENIATKIQSPVRETATKIEKEPTKMQSPVRKFVATPKSVSGVGRRNRKKKLQTPIKLEPNEEMVKSHGKNSAQGEGPVRVLTPESAFRKDKENLENPDADEISTRED